MSNTGKDYCGTDIKPWIIIIVIFGIITVIWASVTSEEIFTKRDKRDKVAARARQGQMVQNGFPVSPEPQIHLVRNQSPINSNNMIFNGITRATPYGGSQLIRATAPLAFQDVFKNAIRVVEPAVVDVHATFINQPTVNQRGKNPNAPAFNKPFTGNTDRFIGSKSYENIGAGFIVDSRGYLITNYHVVANALNIVVTVTDPQPRDFQAKVVRSDPALDIAMLKIVGNGTFSVCPIGNSGRTSIGDWVIAIGSPFGLDMSVTAGIISGKRKAITIDGTVYKNLIQTDTPINKGNSGGPLINLNGEVIGITTAIYAPTGVFSGTGFAIPIDSIKGFLRDVLGPNIQGAITPVAFRTNIPQQQNTGRSLGVEVVPINAVMAREFRLPVKRGVIVNKVIVNSAAADAGILRGDAIVAINDVLVMVGEQIPIILQNTAHKRSVVVTYYRNGQENDCTVFF